MEKKVNCETLSKNSTHSCFPSQKQLKTVAQLCLWKHLQGSCMHMYVHVQMQTHPYIQHSEIHMLNYVTAAQTLPNASSDPIYTFTLHAPKSCCALSLLASV